MLSEAVDQMLRNQSVGPQREQQLAEQRSGMRQLDSWLGQVEDLLEVDQPTVPALWVKEMAKCLRLLVPPLHRDLLQIPERKASLILDVLFEAQEMLRQRSRKILLHGSRTKKKETAMIA
ncbi:MAG: hypothetical protein ACREN8_06525 [Candidatus Dormibacteraceae bacterium]